jgi:micrococcal nuclease
MKTLSIVSILSFNSLSIYAHKGTTDKHGGHDDRETGSYHYHSAGFSHDPSNPFQDHTQCGMCNISIHPEVEKTRSTLSTEVEKTRPTLSTEAEKIRSILSTAARGKVTRIISGDVVELEGGEKVRYIGIDSPETDHPTSGTEPFGKEAFEYNKQLVKDREVLLLFDVEQRDKNGWLLAYVFVDILFVNAELVRYGYANSLNHPTNTKYQKLFQDLEKQAKEKKIGLWGLLPEGDDKNIKSQNPIPEEKRETTVYVNLSGKKYHTENCKLLSVNKIQMPFEDAKQNYSPCEECRPSN